MCECVEQIEEKIQSHLEENKVHKKPVKSVSLRGKVLGFNDEGGLSAATVSYFDIDLEGQKKMAETTVRQSFCPFCGEKK